MQRVHCLLLVGTLLAASAQARTVVVPSPPISEEAAAVYETRVLAHNPGPSALSVERSALSFAAAQGSPSKSRSLVPAGGEATFSPGARFRGLLQLEGDSALAYTARLVPRGPSEEPGIDLPVVGNEDRLSPGESALLTGLVSTGSTFANLALINLSQSPSRCLLTLSRGDGTLLGPALTMTLPPRTNLPFLDLFEGRGAKGDIAEARAGVSCDQDFYAYALLADGLSGRLQVVTPARELAAAPIAGAITPCPAGASCFDADGLVHVPAPPPGLPVGRVAFPAPAGVAKRFRLSLDVTVADWYSQQPSGKALIYWFVVSKNPDMPGLLYFRGPGKEQAFARHGMGLKHPDKIKIIQHFNAQVGHTYHVDNDYDMAGRSYKITITDVATGQVAVTLQGRPNVTSFTIKPALKLLVDMGFPPGIVPTEVPSYGWKYSNVHVEVYKQ